MSRRTIGWAKTYLLTLTNASRFYNEGFEGFLRLRAGSYRIFFQETADSITVHRVRDRKDAYR